jgi:hypothetical protein
MTSAWCEHLWWGMLDSRDIMAAIGATAGNVTAAADVLGISHRHLCRLLHQYGLWRQVDKLRGPGWLAPLSRSVSLIVKYRPAGAER